MAREYVLLRNCPVRWTNFSGTKSQYNPQGYRTFNVVLDEDTANDLRERGLNIKTHLNSKGEDPIYTLQVTLSFSPYPPDEVYRVIPKGKIELTEKTIGALDHEEIDHVDVKLSLSHWTMGNNSGIKAYVSKLAVHVNEDDFENYYRNIPSIGGASDIDQNQFEETADDGDIPF